MAQKKLLFLLSLGLLYVPLASGFELENQRKDRQKSVRTQELSDDSFSRRLAKQARQITNLSVKEKWAELQDIMRNSTNQTESFKEDFDALKENIGDNLEQTVMLKIFVSSSMGNTLLKHYINEAKKYNAVLILNGLPGGSWRKLSSLVYDISDGDNEKIALQIDDKAFKEYGISSVPSFVLVKEPGIFSEDDDKIGNKVIYDKVSGNIGIKRALEIITKEGELSDYVIDILKNDNNKQSEDS